MEIFNKNGLKFKCQRCSACCGKSPGFVFLSKKDLEKLCDFFSMKPAEFVEKYCRWTVYYEGKTVLALFEQKNYDCVLWNNGCSAYEARPVQCRTYPFWDWMIKSEEMWNECAADCPGMNQGPLHSAEEILLQAEEYVQNEPITLEEYNSLNFELL
ncbi:MAG: YkgJ family cysteine cluster protein [Treponema sp.]|nr:YkgJ family cysteine cluster protein [Treponema sp.]